MACVQYDCRGCVDVIFLALLLACKWDIIRDPEVSQLFLRSEQCDPAMVCHPQKSFHNSDTSLLCFNTIRPKVLNERADVSFELANLS